MGRKATLYLLHNILIVITLCLLAIAIVAWFAGRVSPLKCDILPFVGLAMMVILGANLLALIYWAVRLKLWVIVPIVALVLNYNYVSAIYQLPFGCTPNVVAGQQQMRIATYNVHNFAYLKRGNGCFEQITYYMRQHADVVCFQEFVFPRDMDATSVAEALGLPYHSIVDSKTYGLDLAIFSRFPILCSRRCFFPTGRSSMLVSDLAVGSDTVRVINTHLQTTSVNNNRYNLSRSFLLGDSAAETQAIKNMTDSLTSNFDRRAIQAQLLMREVSGSPYRVVVCGDFNDTPASYTYHLISRNMTDGFRACGSGYGYTFRTFGKMLRIDYIMYSAGLKGIGYTSEDLEWSDHKSVVMTLLLQGNRETEH